MWRQQHRDSREHFDGGREYGSRDNYRDQNTRRDERHVRERHRESYREDYDTYNTKYGEGRANDESGVDVGYTDDAGRGERRYWETNPEDARYRDNYGRTGQDDRYRDDGGRVPEDDRFREDRGWIPENDRYRDEDGRAEERDRYRDNQGWDREEAYDRREVRDVRVTDAHADHVESDRSLYRRDQEEYEDRFDSARDNRDWGGDRPHQAEDYRNNEELYREDRNEYRNDRRDDYRSRERGNYRAEDTVRYRTDRDRNTSDVERDKFDHKKDNTRFTDSDKGGFRFEPTRDRNGRNSGANRAATAKARPGRNLPQNKISSQSLKTVDDNKGKISGHGSFGQRYGRQEQQRQNEFANKRKGLNNKNFNTSAVNRAKNETFISPKSKPADGGGFSGRSSRDLVDRKKTENLQKGPAGYSSRDKTSGEAKTEIVITLEQKNPPAPKTQHMSGSDSKHKGGNKIDAKTEHRRTHSESEKSRKSSRDRENHDKRRNRNDSSHHAESNLDSSKVYGSFHEDDAISILADDDRFTHETRSYLATDKHSSDEKLKIKSNTKDLTKKKSSDASASVYDDKYSSRKRTGNTRRHDIKTESTRSKSKDSYRDRGNQIRSRSGKTSEPIRKTFHKFGHSRFEKRNDNVAFRNRNVTLKHKSDQGQTRQHLSSKGKEHALVRIGRTGAVLKDDRFRDSNEIERGVDGKRFEQDNAKDKNDLGRYKGRGIHSSNNIKRKYLWKGLNRRSNIAFSKKVRDEGKDGDDDQSEHFSKFRNERDEQDFNRRSSLNEELRSHDDLGPSDQNRQIIFIPNPEYSEGHAPVLDQFGNTLINPDHSASFQQQIPQPVQFIPSNLPGEAPPGTEYVFIPFVNDPSATMPDNTVNLSDDKVDAKVGDQEMLDRKHEPNISELRQEENPAPLKRKPLSELMRYKIRLKLAQRRKILLEKRLEKRIWKRLILKKEAEEKAMALTRAKPKPTIKRLSPPGASTARGQGQKSEDLDDISPDEYENVSDLEDITDDENGERSGGEFGRTGERRQAFRKPGEPRLAVRKRTVTDTARPIIDNQVPARPKVNNTTPARLRVSNTASARSRASNSQSWQFNDIRKVVERKADPQKRRKGPENDNPPVVKKSKVSSDFHRQRPRTPIKITVSNDQFIEEEDNDFRDDDRHEQRRSRSAEWRSGSRESHHDQKRGKDRRDSNEYNKKHRDDRDRYSDKRKESPRRQSPRQTENKRRGKYEDKDYDRRPRKSRFSDAEEPRGGNRHGQLTNNAHRPSANQMSSNFINNRSPQNFSAPFSQLSQARNQFSSPQSLPFGFQQAGLGQQGLQMGSSDPSLPPVSQGPMNMAAFGQPNLAVNPDMSLPPTVGPVAGQSSMILPSNNFSQQNMQSPLQMQQGLFPSAMQTQALAQQQQQAQQMTPSLLGVGPVQGNTAINQQNIQGSMQGSGGGFQASNSPLYQQSRLGMNSQSGNIQQQSMMGTMVPTGNQAQRALTNSLQNQQSKQIMINNPFVTGQQGFISGKSKTKDSYTPTTLNEAMHNIGNLGTNSPAGAGKSVRPQGRLIPQNKTQVYSSTRGMHQVPRDSGILQQKTGVHRLDNRTGKRANDVFISQPGPSAYSGEDIDEEIGELLCMKCDKVLLSESVMRRHAKWHVLAEAGVEDLRCDTCQQGFTSSIAFNVHMREWHTGTMLKCNQCDLTFTNSAALARHNRAGIHHSM